MLSANDVSTPIEQLAKKLICGYYSSIMRFREQYEFIHILSHMRSGSSLLTHLLISNPDICGYGETHITYSTPQDFQVLIGKVLYMLRRFPGPGRERYILDKVLHNWLLTPENVELLCNGKCHVIFLLREPHGTLASLMKSLKYSEPRAVNYYLNRLATLEKYARELTRHNSCVVLTYEQILCQTDRTFEQLERFLDLQQPLSETYQILHTTGKRGVGDSSQNIFSGSIVRNRKLEHLQVSDESFNAAWEAFRRCHIALTQCCISVDPVKRYACA